MGWFLTMAVKPYLSLYYYTVISDRVLSLRFCHMDKLCYLDYAEISCQRFTTTLYLISVIFWYLTSGYLVSRVKVSWLILAQSSWSLLLYLREQETQSISRRYLIMLIYKGFLVQSQLQAYMIGGVCPEVTKFCHVVNQANCDVVENLHYTI